MLRFLGRRLRQFIPVLVLVTFFTTALSNLLPSSPAYAIYGTGATPRFVANFNKEFGLNKPLFERYWDWILAALHGNLGISYESHLTVASQLVQRFPVTLEIAVAALICSLVISIPVAMAAANWEGGIFDRVVTGLTSIAISTPAFVSAVILVYLFAIEVRWFPVVGWVSLSANVSGNISHSMLPVTTLVIILAPVFIRILRGDIVSMLHAPFADAARSRGAPEWFVLTRHVLRPASTSLVTVAGISFGALIGGAVIVETFFSLPGVGSLAVQSVLVKDIPVIQGIVVCVAITFVAINALVDLSYGLIDPRVRDLS